MQLLQIEKGIVEQNLENENSAEIWDSDNFQWNEECRDVLRDVFKLNDFRRLQRFFNALSVKVIRNPFDSIRTELWTF